MLCVFVVEVVQVVEECEFGGEGGSGWAPDDGAEISSLCVNVHVRLWLSRWVLLPGKLVCAILKLC